MTSRIISSSSITRIEGRVDIGWANSVDTLQWELELKGGAQACSALHADSPGMLLDDAIADGETEACTSTHFLGREKRIVNSFDVLIGNPATGILNSNHQLRVLTVSPHRQLTAGRHRVFGIEKKVHEYLLKLSSIGHGGREHWVQIQLDIDIGLSKLVIQQGKGFQH